MAERYSKLFSLPENLYAQGSPVVIAAGALLKDNVAGNVLAQLKIQSISDKPIKAVKVAVTPLDSVGRLLGGEIEHQYLDLSAKRDDFFGVKTPVALPDATTRSYTVRVVEVAFGDNSLWNEAGAPCETLPKQRTLASALGDAGIAEQYKKDVGNNWSDREPAEHKDLWLCACGAINKRSEPCHKCLKTFAELTNFDVEKLKENREAWRKNNIYSEAEKLMKQGAYQWAINEFARIPGWKDADEKIYTCQKKIEEIKAKAEADRLEKERIAKRNKKIAIITCAIIAFIIILNTVIIPNGKYNDAIALMDAEKYTEAISAFEALEGYKDSATKINECNTAILDGKYNDAIALMNAGNLDEAYGIFTELGNYKDAADKAGDIRLTKFKETLKGIKVGNYIKFGAYEQDNNTSNGKEDVEWLVLEVKDGKALVISKYALDCQQYNTEVNYVTWETCTLRKWLNNDFIHAAFSAEEKAVIPTVTVSADKNPKYSTDPGNATQDQVFLLSITEVNKYFSSDSARQCEPTDYAVAGGARVNSSNGSCRWWLRSPGRYQTRAAYVSYVEGVNEYGSVVNDDTYAVRPALWIDLG